MSGVFAIVPSDECGLLAIDLRSDSMAKDASRAKSGSKGKETREDLTRLGADYLNSMIN